MTAVPAPPDHIPVENQKHIRAELRRLMPPEAFEPQPLRGVIALALVPVMVGMAWVAGSGMFPWWGSLAISFTIGLLLATVGFAAHESLHHSVFRNRALETLLGAIGFAPFLVTPGTWRAWHVQAHHSAPNIHERDPDILPRQKDWLSDLFFRGFHALAPGSRTLISYITFTFVFAAQGQAFLWHFASQPGCQHVRMNRVRERVLTVLLLSAWVALGWAMGLHAALYALILPFAFGNINLMMYISTNHWLQPASDDTDNPFVNTASVATHPLLDLIHLNFSYHQEHHVFPAMSPRFAPLLRKHLRTLNPAASIVYPHLATLWMLYRRPALYGATGDTFVGRHGTPAVPVAGIRQRLEAGMRQ